MSYNILIVDDDELFRSEFKDAMDEYEVIEAADGLKALEILKKPNMIDLVVLDVIMPGMRGTEVLKELKKLRPDLTVIMLTGHSSKDVAIDSLKGRADEYVEKPVEVEKLKELIATLLRGKEIGELDAQDISDKIEKVKRFLERNFDRKVGLEDAAAAIAVSPQYLSRIFKEHAGTGFADFRARVKIDRSKEMLATTGYNVNQISEKLGYENAETFIRAFKKLEGMTPSEYRSKQRTR